MEAQAQGGMSCAHRRRILLALVILSWGISWPLIKVGVAAVPPIWYACFRYAIAAACLFVVLAERREAAFPPRGDWPLVVLSGVFQMAAYSALVAVALTVLPPGRASVLAFSTPIWVVPLAAWWLNERASRTALFGIMLGLLGVAAIAAPAFRADNGEQILGYAMLLGAAFSWAISIVAVRAHRFTASTLALAPWQMLVSVCLLLPVALVLEGPPQPIGAVGAASLAFVGPVATAFAYWAVVEVGRHFRAAVLSMALLAAPTLGVLISALSLGESVGASLLAGMLCIAAGIRRVTTDLAGLELSSRTHTAPMITAIGSASTRTKSSRFGVSK
jgi:drug/metabolite transporter (DMT)-like permease